MHLSSSLLTPSLGHTSAHSWHQYMFVNKKNTTSYQLTRKSQDSWALPDCWVWKACPDTTQNAASGVAGKPEANSMYIRHVRLFCFLYRFYT